MNTGLSVEIDGSAAEKGSRSVVKSLLAMAEAADNTSDTITNFARKAKTAFDTVREAWQRVRSIPEELGEVVMSPLNSMGRGIDNIRRKIFSLQGALAGLGATFSIKAVIGTFEQFDEITSTLAPAVGGMRNAAQEVRFMTQEIQAAGLPLRETLDGYVSLANQARGTRLSLDQVRDSVLAVSRSMLVMSKGGQETTEVFGALQSILGRNTVNARQLGLTLSRSLPGAMELTARGLKMSRDELIANIEAGNLLAEQLIPAITQALEQQFGPAWQGAATSTTGLINKMKTSWELFLLRVSNAGAIDGINRAFAKLTATLEHPALKDLADVFGRVIGPAVSSLASAVSFLARNWIVLAAVVAMFIGLKISSYFATLSVKVFLAYRALSLFTGGVALLPLVLSKLTPLFLILFGNVTHLLDAMGRLSGWTMALLDPLIMKLKRAGQSGSAVSGVFRLMAEKLGMLQKSMIDTTLGLERIVKTFVSFVRVSAILLAVGVALYYLSNQTVTAHNRTFALRDVMKSVWTDIKHYIRGAIIELDTFLTKIANQGWMGALGAATRATLGFMTSGFRTMFWEMIIGPDRAEASEREFKRRMGITDTKPLQLTPEQQGAAMSAYIAIEKERVAQQGLLEARKKGSEALKDYIAQQRTLEAILPHNIALESEVGQTIYRSARALEDLKEQINQQADTEAAQNDITTRINTLNKALTAQRQLATILKTSTQAYDEQVHVVRTRLELAQLEGKVSKDRINQAVQLSEALRKEEESNQARRSMAQAFEDASVELMFAFEQMKALSSATEDYEKALADVVTFQEAFNQARRHGTNVTWDEVEALAAYLNLVRGAKDLAEDQRKTREQEKRVAESYKTTLEGLGQELSLQRKLNDGYRRGVDLSREVSIEEMVLSEAKRLGLKLDDERINRLRQIISELKIEKGVTDELLEAQNKHKEALREVEEIRKEMLTPLQRYNEELERLKNLQDSAGLSAELAAKKQKQALDRLKQDQIEAFRETHRVLMSTWDAFSNAFEGVLTGIVQGTQTLKNAFKAMADAIVAELMRIIARMLLIMLLEKMIGIFGGASAGKSASTASTTPQSAISPGSWLSRFSPSRQLSRGGIARMPSLVAEDYRPEAVVPLPDGRSIPVRMSGGMGVMPHVEVNMINQGTPKEVAKATPRFDGRQFVVDVVLKDVAENGPIARALGGK